MLHSMNQPFTHRFPLLIAVATSVLERIIDSKDEQRGTDERQYLFSHTTIFTSVTGISNYNNNNNYNNVYGAIIMTKVIARVYMVYLMNVDCAPGDHQPSGQASQLGLCSM